MANKNKQTPLPISKSNSQLPALIFILVATLFVYFPSLQNQFINSWDDNHFVTENPAITSLTFQNIKYIFTHTLLNMYSPLTITSFAVDYAIWGFKPFGYHFTNLLFHLGNTLLVFAVFSKITKQQWVVLFVTSMFALHPMHVESVAWISERKDVLYAFFYLSAMFTYLNFIESKENKYLIYTLLLFVISCLAKPMAITLPVILALLQWYKSSEKFNFKDYMPVLMLSLVSIVFGLIPFLFHDTGNLTDNLSSKFNLLDRLFLLTYAIGFYLVKTILPLQQAAFHYYPDKINNALPSIYYLSVIVIPLLAVVVWKLKSVQKDVLFSLLFFLVSIALVLKIVPFGNAVVAERYTYLPYLGLFFGIGLGLNDVFKSDSTKTITLLVASIILGIVSFNRLSVWKNSISLFTDIIAKYPAVAIPYSIRGDAYSKEENNSAALNDYNSAIALDPANFEAYINRGVIFFKTNQYAEAVKDYDKAATLKQDIPKLYFNRGTCLLKLNAHSKALLDFEKVLLIEPNNVEALSAAGLCQYNLKQFPEAIALFDKAISINPTDFETLKNRGNTKAYLKDLKGSIADYTTIIEANPNDANALSNRGNSYYQLQQLEMACKDWKIAAQLGNANAIGAVGAICK